MPHIEDNAQAEDSLDDSGVDAATSPASVLFDALCDQYYHSWFRYHPETAVDVGVYDYAAQLRSYDHDDIGALIALNQKIHCLCTGRVQLF